MSITNEQRHNLYQRLEQILGHEEATTLMDHLPPVGWNDVATKQALGGETALLRGELDHQIGQLRNALSTTETVLRLEITSQCDRLRSEMHRSQRDMVFAMVGSNATFAALLFAALRLT